MTSSHTLKLSACDEVISCYCWFVFFMLFFVLITQQVFRSLQRSRVVDLYRLGGSQRAVAPPSISQPGRRAAAARRVKAEASDRDRSEAAGFRLVLSQGGRIKLLSSGSHAANSGLKTPRGFLRFLQQGARHREDSLLTLL